MFKKSLLFASLLLLISVQSHSQLQSPDDFLPHDIGEAFTPHYMLVDYMHHVAENSPMVEIMQYGLTNEKRPLLLLFISTEENLARLEDIRLNNLRKTGMADGEIDPGLDRAITWLSFSVHGNEAAGSESSMPVLYELVRPDNEQTKSWLENTIVIMDPSINPDGYARFAHWTRRVGTEIPIPETHTRQHDEPWPGGRVNHYQFDLNRDWAWQTQIESRQRLVQYQNWYPHIHVDFHEQSSNSPYYFAPAARPFHQYITPWQRDFQVEIGKNNARYFDREGWLYFTKEVFDLLYPSYGDTYPTFNGAIGMTYEQAGGRSTAVLLDNGDTLTLRDRVAHHKTTALSTIEIASQQADRLVDHFEEYFQQAVNSPQGDYKTYIVKGSNPPKRIKALCSLLDKNQIAYGRTSRSQSMEGYSYQTGKTVDINIEEGDLLISAYQPKSVLTQVLMEPKTALEDSLTYDITAWALPYAYGLETYATRIRIDPDASPRFPEYRHALSPDERPYAYVAAWNSLDDVRFLAALQKAGVKVRYATEPFAVEGHQYPRGTLIISRADNRKMGSHTARIVDRLARQFEPDIRAVQTGFVSKGPDFGSRAMEYIQQPRIAVIGGEGISIYSFGQVWHYFERELDYPIHIVDKDIMSSSDLDHYNLLIMPEGRYGIGNSEADRLDDWVSAGGRLIAIGSAVRSLEGEDGFEIAEFVEKEDEKSYEEEMEEEEMQLRLEAYGGAERRFIAGFIPGAIIKLQLDETHPLAFGLGDHYFSLKTNNLFYQHQTEAWNVARVEGEPLISGFVGAKAKKRLEKTTTFAVQERGRGAVIYLVDNPLYRAFWENGKFLFGNAVFFAGQ